MRRRTLIAAAVLAPLAAGSSADAGEGGPPKPPPAAQAKGQGQAQGQGGGQPDTAGDAEGEQIPPDDSATGDDQGVGTRPTAGDGESGGGRPVGVPDQGEVPVRRDPAEKRSQRRGARHT